jgi:predicted amino acid racemase
VNRITLNIEAIKHNLAMVNGWVRGHGARMTVVTKALCGNEQALNALHRLGVESMGDSRLANLEAIARAVPGVETWYLRPPHRSAISEIVGLSDVSLNTELAVIKELNEEAARKDRLHHVIIMVELGDLREGILPGALIKLYREVFDLPNIEVLGIGANLGCLTGCVPNIDQLMQLVLYRELLQLKFDRKLPLISAGSSAVLPLLLDGRLPKTVNHFRVGETILLGTDLVNGGTIEGLRDDGARLEAEVIEIQEKSLIPLGETVEMTPFAPVEEEESFAPGQRGYRALVAVGQLDTDIGGLTPVDPNRKIAGASSDITVVNLGEDPGGLKVGDTIDFRMGYSGFVRLMANKYTDKEVLPLPPEAENVDPAMRAMLQVPAVAAGLGLHGGTADRAG